MSKVYRQKGVTVTDRNDGFKNLIRRLDDLNGGSLYNGIFERSKNDEGESVAQYAAAHEFGARIKRKKRAYTAGGFAMVSRVWLIPQRSFIRSTMDERKEKYFKFVEKKYAEAISGFSIKGRKQATLLSIIPRLGEIIKGDIKRKIITLKSPPLAESTKLRKAKSLRGEKRAAFIGGAGNPLIDTGTMLNSVEWEIRKQ